MTRDEVKTIIRIMVATWPNYKPADLSQTVDVWTEMIGDINFGLAKAAIKAYAQTDTTGFAPSVGQLRAKVVELTSRQSMSEADAWETIVRAVRRSSYYSVEEFNKLSPELQEAVGGPETLRSLAAEDESRISFAKPGIMKNFQIAQQRQRERLQLSADVRALLDKQRALPEREVI